MQLAQPTPSAKTTDKRIADILASVRVAFAEKGFDGASMQDLARAAGISVGNFYRYFPSKSSIVEQLIAHDLAEMEQEFSTVICSPDPLGDLRKQAALRIDKHQCNKDGQLWAEITANALRKPEIGAACMVMESTISAYLQQVFVAATGLPAAEVKHRFSAHAALIILLIKSVSMMAPQSDAASDDLNALVLRTINQCLDEVAGASVRDKNA